MPANPVQLEVDRLAQLWAAEGRQFSGDTYNSMMRSIFQTMTTSLDFLHVYREGKKRLLMAYPTEHDTDAFKKHMVSGVIALYEHSIKIDQLFDERPESDPIEFRPLTNQKLVWQTSDGMPIIVPEGVEKGEYVHYTTMYQWMNAAASDSDFKPADFFIDLSKYKM